MGKIIRNGVEYSGACETATAVNYDNSLSGLNAQTVQEAIDELSGLADGSGNGSNQSLEIKCETFSGTTDGNGFLITSLSLDNNVMCAKIVSGLNTFTFPYQDKAAGIWTIKFMHYDMSVHSNQSVSVEIYYF